MDSVAKLTMMGCTDAPEVARRSCSRGRLSSGEGERDDLMHEKLLGRVTRMRKDLEKCKETVSGSGVAHLAGERRKTAAEMADGGGFNSSSPTAIWTRVFGGNEEEGQGYLQGRRGETNRVI